jgi:chaperonin GroES
MPETMNQFSNPPAATPDNTDYAAPVYETPQPPVPKNIQKLIDWSTSKNIAEDVDEKILETLGSLVVAEHDIDEKSREQWMKQTQEALQLASMIAKKKTFPYEDAANIVFPLLSMGAVQFASRTLPTIVQDGMVIKCKIVGRKTDEKIARSERVSDHMSFQVTEQIDGWLESTDSLLHYYAIAGLAHKKTYQCVEKGKPESDFIRCEDLVINYWTKTPETARRITHKYEIEQNDLVTKKRTKEYLDVDLGEGESDSKTGDPSESQNPYEIYEQSRWYDLDGDGYAEPINVFVHAKTKQVLRITARYREEDIAWNDKDEVTYIQPECYYTKYFFMPSLDGSYYSMGFGQLLGHSNKAVNSIINQMLDAGTLQNAGGGLMSDDLEIFGPNKRAGKFMMEPGTYLLARDKGTGNDLRSKMIQFQFPGPSPALFELLNLIITSSQRLGQSVEVLSGDVSQADQPATTTLALIEQATKMFTAIRERLFNSLKQEFRKLHRLNRRYLSDMDYNKMLDDRAYQIAKADYEDDDLDVMPIADPRDATDAQKLLKAQALQDFVARPILNPRQRKAALLYLQALNIEDAEEYLPTDQEMGSPPLDVQLKQAEIANRQGEIALKEREIELMERKWDEAERGQIVADSIYKIANAESKEAGSQLDQYKTVLDQWSTHSKLEVERLKVEQAKMAQAVQQNSNSGGSNAGTAGE